MAIAKCSCGATRAVYSHCMIGVKDALKVKDRENRSRTLENDGYSCGDEVKGGGKFFYSKRSLRCGDPIESEYYNPGAGTKGGRIETEDVCCICYVDQDLMTPNDIKKVRDLGGKTPLIMCRACADDKSIEPLLSRARTNISQANKQKRATKKRKMDKRVENGKRKARSA